MVKRGGCSRDVRRRRPVSWRGSLALQRMQHAVGGVEDSGGHEHAQHDARFHCDAHWHSPKNEPGNAELPKEGDGGGAQHGDHEGLEHLRAGMRRKCGFEFGGEGGYCAAAFGCAFGHDAGRRQPG